MLRALQCQEPEDTKAKHLPPKPKFLPPKRPKATPKTGAGSAHCSGCQSQKTVSHSDGSHIAVQAKANLLQKPDTKLKHVPPKAKFLPPKKPKAAPKTVTGQPRGNSDDVNSDGSQIAVQAKSNLLR